MQWAFHGHQTLLLRASIEIHVPAISPHAPSSPHPNTHHDEQTISRRLPTNSWYCNEIHFSQTAVELLHSVTDQQYQPNFSEEKTQLEMLAVRSKDFGPGPGRPDKPTAGKPKPGGRIL